MVKAIEIIEIELDKPRKIIFNHAALRLAETAVNRSRGSHPSAWLSIESIITAALSQRIFPADLTEILLWAGLVQEDPKLTVADVSNLIGTARIYVNEKLSEAVNAYWRKSADAPPDEDPERPTTRLNGGSAVGPSDGSNLN